MLPPRGVSFASDSAWVGLIEGLRSAGHEVEGYGQLGQGCDAVVALNHQDTVRHVQGKYGVPTERSVLVLLEPRVTDPRMYTRRVLKLYGHRHAASAIWADHVNAEPFLWPQALAPRSFGPESDAFDATLINGDKRSAVRGSLYGLRRSVMSACERDSVSLAVFGPGWATSVPKRLLLSARSVAKATRAGQVPYISEAMGNLSLRPGNWLGTVDDKASALNLSRQTIVIENSADYVSEKLIDAVRAGVVPLYVGPRLGAFKLPSDIAVDCKPHAQEIVETLRRLPDSRRSEVREAGQRWLESQEARAHDARNVLRDLGMRVGTQLGHRG